MSNPKPETRFTGNIHKHLPRTVYHEKMNNPYRSGTPDVYYSGEKGDLWVEYKYLEKLPRNVVPALTEQQRRWLNNRHDEGRNVAVILGTPKGAVIYRNKEWDTSLLREQIEVIMLTNKEVSLWIYSQVGDSRWLYTERL